MSKNTCINHGKGNCKGRLDKKLPAPGSIKHKIPEKSQRVITQLTLLNLIEYYLLTP